MAKCIRVVGQGVPVRVSDDDALRVVVRNHDGEYCSKRVWREFWAGHEPYDNGLRRLAGPKGNTISEVSTLARNLQHKRQKRA